MKRIIISAICVVMCCIFLCQYVAAEVAKANFNVNSVFLGNIYAYQNGALYTTLTPNKTGVYRSGSYYFDNVVSLTTSSMNQWDFIAAYQITGSWDNTNVTPTSYLWFNVQVDYTSNYAIRDGELLLDQIRLTLDNGLSFSDYFISDTGNYSYILSFLLPLDEIDYNFIGMKSFTINLPMDCDTGDGASTSTISSILNLGNVELTYDLSAITSEDVDVIINSIDNVEVMLDEVTQNQNIVIDEIITTREVIEQNGEKLQEISNKQDTIITEIEQLPVALRDLEVGDPYDKSLDTSEIVAYESAYEKVMEEVDVDQVVNIMDGGISLNQDGMYNEQSFNSVSGLVMDIIDVTGLMPLIMISLTFGLACFIIGRSGNL